MFRNRYYVVNAASGGRQSTHIVNANRRTPYHPNPWHPGNLIVQLATAGRTVTLCGLWAGRRVDVFTPARRRPGNAASGGSSPLPVTRARAASPSFVCPAAWRTAMTRRWS